MKRYDYYKFENPNQGFHGVSNKGKWVRWKDVKKLKKKVKILEAALKEMEQARNNYRTRLFEKMGND